MNFANQIEEIIAKRHEQAQILGSVTEKWKSLRRKLEELEKERKKHISTISDTNSKSYLSLNRINLSDWIEKISQKIEELENLKTKLSRKTLNIGVVGRMRQGKSQLLQSLTGLTDDEIPTSPDGVCTRTLSKVFHAPGETRSEVEFHSPDSLLKIIHQYYDHLKLPADSKPQSIDDFASIESNKFPKLSDESKKDPTFRYLYGRLRGDYYTNYKEYKESLKGNTKTIPVTKIIDYAAPKKQNSNGQANKEYLAVKELRIFGNFLDRDELGKIGVVDLPGLDDDVVADTELLIKTLKQDVDFILFVRKPDPSGDNWQESDRNMYRLAKKALNGFPLEECSFMVLNKDKDKPEKSKADCNRFRDEIESQGIEVSQVVIADCTKSSDVKQKIMDHALDNLTKNIGLVYKQYLRSHNQDLKTFKSEIAEKLNEAANALEGYQQSEKQHFHYWFNDEVWKKFAEKMIDQGDELDNKQPEKHSQFEEQVNQVVEDCLKEDIIPNTSEIKGYRADVVGSYKMAYYTCINQVKANLTKKFTVLAEVLEASEKKSQLLVAKILYEQGKLQEHNLFQEYQLNEETCFKFLDAVETLIPDSSPKLKQAIEEIKTTSTHRNAINEWIQPHIDTLKPDEHLDPISKDQFLTNEFLTNDEIKKTVSELPEDQVDVNEFGEISQKPQEEISPEVLSEEVLSEIAEFISSKTNLPIPLPQTLIKSILHFTLEKSSALLQELIKKRKSEDMTNEALLTTKKLSSEESIRAEIDFLRKKVVENCRHTLEKNLNYPNEIAYAKFDKFVSIALKGKDARTEWRIFYDDEKNKELWPGNKIEENAQKEKQHWQDLVDKARNANSDGDLLIE